MFRRLSRFVALVLALGAVSLSFSGCFRKKYDWIELNKDRLFRSVLNHEKPDEIEIHTLDAYELDENIYFHVTYTHFSHAFDEWRDLDLVYFGKRRIDLYFSFAWKEWGEMEVYRDAYYEAVAKGRHREFSEDEIRECVDAFYASGIE
ncbi:MAG: hypothetical protein IKP55_07800 [Clostridia bacterium]|nr:hypothetical protein [Clostridia bacterium]